MANCLAAKRPQVKRTSPEPHLRHQFSHLLSHLLSHNPNHQFSHRCHRHSLRFGHRCPQARVAHQCAQSHRQPSPAARQECHHHRLVSLRHLQDQQCLLARHRLQLPGQPVSRHQLAVKLAHLPRKGSLPARKIHATTMTMKKGK